MSGYRTGSSPICACGGKDGCQRPSYDLTVLRVCSYRRQAVALRRNPRSGALEDTQLRKLLLLEVLFFSREAARGASRYEIRRTACC